MSIRLATIGAMSVAAIGVAIAAQSGHPVRPAPPISLASATPVAVELFTSQGCSSCPPADALLGRLARDPKIVAITRPVTYWDNLGWKDTLAREGNTDLQRAYAARGGVGAGVYTPQAMVQGGSAAVGSSEAQLRALIGAAQARPGPSVAAATTPDGGRAITISGAAVPDASVTVVALRSSADVRIGNGENGGRSIHYVNIVVGEKRIGALSGGHGTFRVPASALHAAGADRAALIVRQGTAGRIVAARYL